MFKNNFHKMGNPQSKPKEKLVNIDREVNSIRSSLRGSKRGITKDTKEAFVQNLAHNSSVLESLKGKVKQQHLDLTMRNISQTMNEVLSITPREPDVDSGSVETNSFIQLPVNKRKSISGSSTFEKKSKTLDIPSSQPPTFTNIERKLETLKPQIKTAIENRDTKSLRLHQQTIKILAGDLEMISVEEETPLHDLKNKLQKQLTSSYQKINRAMKEIKRDDNIQYLTTQNKKEKAIKELEEVHKSLEEDESLLDWAMKNKETDTLKNIKDNITKINKKLTDVDIIDNQVKEKKLYLSQKIIKITNIIDDATILRNFEHDFAQAKNNYEDLMKNFTNINNKNEIKEKLENLQKFVGNLQPYNDTTTTNKRQLLNNLEKSIENLKQDDQKIVQQIVEDNVILRKEQKNKNNPSELETFYNHWKTVESIFNTKVYPKEVLSRIDKILEEMQHSIGEIRGNIALTDKQKSNLERATSKSTPKLNSAQNCFDDNPQGIIKARAKYYNISTPELLNVNDQLNVTTKYDFNSNRFSHIEEIKTQVYYIKEKLHDSQNKQHLKNKLESYLGILDQYLADTNQTVANNAQLVLNDIQDMLQCLSDPEKTVNRRISIEDSLENIVAVQERVEKFCKEAQHFTGKIDDRNYDRIKQSLLECKKYLENAEIPQKYAMIIQQREQLLVKIANSLNRLDNHTANITIYEDHIVQEKLDNLNKLKDKVRRFSGTYKGVLYNKIEMDLNKLLVDVNEGLENKEVADKITVEVEKHLKILEQRSSKAQSFRHVNNKEFKTEDQENMHKIKNDLISIKSEIDKTPESNVENFVGLKSRLDLVNLELDQISVKSNENLEKDKEIFANEARTLKNVVDAKIALGSRSLQKKLNSIVIKNDPGKEIENLIEEFTTIKPQVNTFSGVQSDSKYLELDQTINKLISKLEGFKFIRGTDLYVQKIKLLKELQEYGELLDKRAKDAEESFQIEKQLQEAEILLDGCTDKDYKHLEQQVVVLRNKINSRSYSDNLDARKTEWLRKVDNLLQTLQTSAEKPDAEKILHEIEANFNKIKPEIELFVGTAADNKFYELDEYSMRLILKLEKLEFTKGSPGYAKRIEILKQLHKYGGILDERARQTEDLLEIEDDLETIKLQIKESKGTEEERRNIKETIIKLIYKMDNIQVTNDFIKRKNACKEECINLLQQYLPKDKDNPHEKPADNRYSGYVSQIFDFTKQSIDEKCLNEIKSNLEKLTTRISVFIDTDCSKEYQEIDQKLSSHTQELEKLHFFKDTPLYVTKVSLLKEIQNCRDVLDERANETGSLIAIEKKMDEIESKITDNANSAKQLNLLDEEFIKLQVQVGKLHVNDDLKERKEKCRSRILYYMKHLKDGGGSKLEAGTIL